MKYTIQKREITLNVTIDDDVEPLRQRFSKQMIKPKEARVSFVGGTFDGITIKGPLVLTGGRLSTKIRPDTWFTAWDVDHREVPGWVVELVTALLLEPGEG